MSTMEKLWLIATIFLLNLGKLANCKQLSYSLLFRFSTMYFLETMASVYTDLLVLYIVERRDLPRNHLFFQSSCRQKNVFEVSMDSTLEFSLCSFKIHDAHLLCVGKFENYEVKFKSKLQDFHCFYSMFWYPRNPTLLYRRGTKGIFVAFTPWWRTKPYFCQCESNLSNLLSKTWQCKQLDMLQR